MPLANYFGARAVAEKCEEIITNYMNEIGFSSAILILDKCGINDLKVRVEFP